jgi:hypothetical protein
MKLMRLLLVGAAVLAVSAVVWWGLALGLARIVGPRSAGLLALVIIVVAGWAANGVLLWRQMKRGPRPPP